MDKVTETRTRRDAAGAGQAGVDERRREVRTRVVVKVTWETAHDFYAGVTGDMSYGGVFIATESPPEPGTDLALAITLPSGKRVEATGRVRWIRTPDLASDELPAGCGVAWLASDARAAQAVRRFLEETDAPFIPPPPPVSNS